MMQHANSLPISLNVLQPQLPSPMGYATRYRQGTANREEHGINPLSSTDGDVAHKDFASKPKSRNEAHSSAGCSSGAPTRAQRYPPPIESSAIKNHLAPMGCLSKMGRFPEVKKNWGKK